MKLLKKKVTLEELGIIAANFSMKHSKTIYDEKKLELGPGENNQISIEAFIELVAFHGYATVVVFGSSGPTDAQMDVFYQSLMSTLLADLTVFMPQESSNEDIEAFLTESSAILMPRVSQYLEILSTKNTMKPNLNLDKTVLINIAKQDTNNVFQHLNFDILYSDILTGFRDILLITKSKRV